MGIFAANEEGKKDEAGPGKTSEAVFLVVDPTTLES